MCLFDKIMLFYMYIDLTVVSIAELMTLTTGTDWKVWEYWEM